MGTAIVHDVARVNITVREDRSIRPGKHTGQCICIPLSVVTEVALVDANAYSLIDTEGS